MSAILFSKTGTLAGLKFEITDEATIGKGQDNTIVLTPPTISSKHARINYDDTEKCYYLEDLNSKNGTKLDGAKVLQRETLGALNIITFAGNYDFIFQQLDVKKELSKEAPPAGKKLTDQTVPADDFVALPKVAKAPMEDFHGTVMAQEVLATPSLSNSIEEDETEVKSSQGTIMAQEVAATPELFNAKNEDSKETDEAVESSHGTEMAQEVTATPDLSAKKDFQLEIKSISKPFELKEGENSIGRALENSVVIDETSISRFHAIITIDGNEVRLKDNGSKNHTFVDDKMIQSVVVITENSIIKFGDVQAKLLLKN